MIDIMESHHLVTAFRPIEQSELEQLQQLNQCMRVVLPSSAWTIHVGTDLDNCFLPEGMDDLRDAMALNRIPHQQIVTFESKAGCFLVVCQINFTDEIVVKAQLQGADAALLFARQFASP